MRLLCDVQVRNRNTQTLLLSAKSATLGVGLYHSARNEAGERKSELELILFTRKSAAGTRYKCVDNIERFHTRFLNMGRATLIFFSPPVDMFLKADAVQMKAFLTILQDGMDGKKSQNLRMNIAAARPIPPRMQPTDSLVIYSRGDFPTKGLPRTLKSLAIGAVGLLKVTFEMCTLKNLTNLDLANNKVNQIPKELGQLALTSLNLENNDMGNCANWRWLQGSVITNTLCELNLRKNNLPCFPPGLLKHKRLVTLTLNENKLRKVPFGISRMISLRFLYLIKNQLDSLPATFFKMHLHVLDVHDNDFGEVSENVLEVVDNRPMVRIRAGPRPPSLWILAVRAVQKFKIPYSNATLPTPLIDIMEESPKCACGKMCFESEIMPRAALFTCPNIHTYMHNSDRLIFADIVLCDTRCAGRSQLIDRVIPIRNIRA